MGDQPSVTPEIARLMRGACIHVSTAQDGPDEHHKFMTHTLKAVARTAVRYYVAEGLAVQIGIAVYPATIPARKVCGGDDLSEGATYYMTYALGADGILSAAATPQVTAGVLSRTNPLDLRRAEDTAGELFCSVMLSDLLRAMLEHPAVQVVMSVCKLD